MGDFTPGVKGVDTFADVPFELDQSVVILGVNNGEFALRQGYLPESIAVSQPPIQKHEKQKRLFEPMRDVNGDLYESSRLEILNSKS
jgi:hypothetical protein